MARLLLLIAASILCGQSTALELVISAIAPKDAMFSLASEPAPGKVQLFVYMNGNIEPSRCYSVERASELLNCRVNLDRRGRHLARIEIVGPGYKRWIRNHQFTRYFRNEHLDIGSVRLEKSDLPKVESLLVSTSRAKAQRFAFTVHNERSKPVLVKKITMLSTVEGWAQCCCVPDSIFEIAQNLKAERSTDSDSELEITGVFAETMQNSGEQFPLRGRAYYQCGGHAFIELELPTSFLLPAATRTVVHVVLPEKLTITDSNYSRKQYFLPELEGKKPSLETIENGKIAFFQDWTFLFTTSEEDEFAIVHSYSARAKKGIGSNLKSESTREAP